MPCLDRKIKKFYYFCNLIKVNINNLMKYGEEF